MHDFKPSWQLSTSMGQRWFGQSVAFQGIYTSAWFASPKYSKTKLCQRNTLSHEGSRIAAQLQSNHTWQVPLGSIRQSYLVYRMLRFSLEVRGSGVAETTRRVKLIQSVYGWTHATKSLKRSISAYGCVATGSHTPYSPLTPSWNLVTPLLGREGRKGRESIQKADEGS